MRLCTLGLLCGLIASLPLQAEIEKLAIPGDEGMCLYWWPKLPSVKGWHHDREHSLQYSMNALAPDGATFATAEAVIYAQAIYKPRESETKSVQMLIDRDKKDFLAQTLDLAISEVDPLVDGDGGALRSVTRSPRTAGSWELVSYGDEGDFYLIFCVSSRSKTGYEAALPAYRDLIRRYKKAP